MHLVLRILILGWAICLWAGYALQAADAGAPTVSRVQPEPGEVSDLQRITVEFNQAIVGVSATDLLINDQPAHAVQGSNHIWTFLCDQPTYGTVLVRWDPGHGITSLSNEPIRFDESAPEASWGYQLVDRSPPVLVSIAPEPGVQVRELAQIEVQFSELVTGVDAGDLLVNGLAVAQMTALGGTRYRFTLPVSVSGPVQMSWQAQHGIQDLAPTPNAFSGGEWACSVDPNLPAVALRINELVAANVSGTVDEDGEPQDWIEVFNAGSNAVNLAGWSLSDDAADPGRWVFPATNLPAGRLLVVFASAKNRRIPGQPLHTNFKLNPNGEYLALFSPELPRKAVSEFAPQFPEQRGDYSYGYDTTNGLKYFAQPTPGDANGASRIVRITPVPHVNIGRGLFDAPFMLHLSHSLAGAVIRWSTDGSEPSSTNGNIYTGPLPISQTTVLRAAAFLEDHLPSATVTHTYVFPAQVVHQPNNPPHMPAGPAAWSGQPSDYEMDPQITTNEAYAGQLDAALRSLPILSLVGSSNDFFGLAASGPGAGIYTHPMSRGPAWERPASAELLLPDGAAGFQANCGAQIQGNANREPVKQPKHSFRLVFKGDFGAARLHYPFFPDSPLEHYDTLVLRADFNNSWLHWSGTQRARGQRVRDAWCKDTMRAMGGLAGHSRFVHLFLNGVYWGVYDPTERPDGTFGETHLGGDKSEYDVIRPEPLEAIDGDLAAWQTLIAFRNLDDPAQYERVQAYLDIPQFIDYTLLQFYAGNRDWGNTKNWYALRRRTPGGQFKFIPWDGERILEGLNDNIVTQTDQPGGLHPRLMSNPEYRLAFADRVHKHLFNQGALTPAAVRERWLRRAAEVDLAMITESARWGDYRRDVHAYSEGPYELYEYNRQYRAEQERLLNQYFPLRTSNLLQQLRAVSLYPAVAAPVPSHPGGRVAQGFRLSFANPYNSSVIYYSTNGVDPRVPINGNVTPGAMAYAGSLTLRSSVEIKARTLLGTNWSALVHLSFNLDPLGVPLRITEIMYKPIGGDAYEYFRVQNIGSTPLSLGNYHMQGVNYVFPPQTTLMPGQSLVLGSLASSPDLWAARYPDLRVAGWFGGSLADGGERLAILDSAEKLVCSVDYDDANGWPPAADGQGPALRMIDVHGDPDAPANWRAELAPSNTGSAVRINEVMAVNVSQVSHDGGYPDWIELHNLDSNAVDLAEWSLTDSSTPRKFVFPAGTILAPGGFLVVWCDANTNAATGFHSGFALDRGGETVSLYTPAGQRADAVTFGQQLADYSLARSEDVEMWRLALPTAGASNVFAPLAPSASLSINEWLTRPFPGDGGWVELFNRDTNAPVALRGLSFATDTSLCSLAALSFVPPGGFTRLWVDLRSGSDHLNLTLSPQSGWMSFYDAFGALIDHVSYMAQQLGVSQGRYPDGTRSIQRFPGSASPGASNFRLNYTGPVINELMAVNGSTLATPNGNTADWVELYNPATNQFDLAGMSLSTSADEPRQWVFPSGTVIASREYLVVWFDGTQPASQAPGFLNTGRVLDGESGAVYLFNSGGQPVDSVEYGFQVRDFSIGRTLGAWNLLAQPTPGWTNSGPSSFAASTHVCINEWMANPRFGDDWIEIYNRADLPVRLGGLRLSDQPLSAAPGEFVIGPLSFIGPRGLIKLLADEQTESGGDHLSFALDGLGESVRLAGPGVGVIDVVYFGAQAVGASQGRLLDGESHIVDFVSTPSPGIPNYLPLAQAVINEILPRAEPPLAPAIELYNPTAQAADLSGWYLSRSLRNLKQFQLAAGTVIPAGGFITLYAEETNGASQSLLTFDTKDGDELILSAADAAGNLTGERALVEFGAARSGAAFGRHYTSAGADFVEMITPTFGVNAPADDGQFRAGTGAWNAEPRVGPVVITEIMFHPLAVGTNDNALDEFIELHNLTDASVTLGSLPGGAWSLDGGIRYVFASGVEIPAHGYLLVVNFDPAANPAFTSAFRARFAVPDGVALAGPFAGKLDNSGDILELYSSESSLSLLVERVAYHYSPPWPQGGRGDGLSFQRRDPHGYGNEPLNWFAAPPSAGQAAANQNPCPPVILVQPLARTLHANESATLAVALAGTRPLNYAWYRNGTLIPGATNSSFLAPVIAGDYQVIITNIAGRVVSQSATILLAVLDTDGDGMPDDWEIENMLNPADPGDAGLDWDHDGIPNALEYLAGTDPRNPASNLRLQVFLDGNLRVGFEARAGKSYVLQFRGSFKTSQWQPLLSIPSATTNRWIDWQEPSGIPHRFFRLMLGEER